MRKRVLALSAYSLLLFSLLASAQDYGVIKLPTLGGARSYAGSINGNGLVVGESGLASSGFSHAFLWSKTGGIQDLGLLNGQTQGNSMAIMINASGQVVGASDSTQFQHAFLWSAATGMQDLGSLDGGASTGTGINSSGQVVGYSAANFGLANHAFLWTQANGMEDLGTLGGDTSIAVGINDAGQVVGFSYLQDGSARAFLWTEADGMRDLGTLGGLNSGAAAINNLGEVAGTSEIADGSQHAFLWTANTGMQDLGTLPGQDNSLGFSLDDLGRVVGSSYHPVGRGNGRPFLWTPADGMIQPGPFRKLPIQQVNTMNVAGQMLVASFGSKGYSSYIASPVMHITLTSSPNPSVAGQPVTFTATVNSPIQGPPPDGEIVTITRGGAVLANAVLQSGVATLTTSTLKTGTQTVRATYEGDSNYDPSKAAPLKQVITK